jgi:hypothetical protein
MVFSCSTESATFSLKKPKEISLPKMVISKNSVVILLADGTEITGCQSRQRINIVLFFSIIQIGDDISSHVDQKNTAYPIVDEILI